MRQQRRRAERRVSGPGAQGDAADRARSLEHDRRLRAAADPAVLCSATASRFDASRTRVGLVIEEPTPVTRMFVRVAFELAAISRCNARRDRRAVRDRALAGRLNGMVVVIRRISRERLRAWHRAADPDHHRRHRAEHRQFRHGYAQGVVANPWQTQRSPELPAPGRHRRSAVEPRFWFNPELESRFFLVPGSIAIVMTLIGTLLTALVVAREWERGTMEAMMATPVGIAEFMIGKLLPYFLLALAPMALCAAWPSFLFGVPLRGSLLALLVGLIAFPRRRSAWAC